jgi:acylphosphatase
VREPRVAVKILVEGLVQGVGFRYGAMRKARALGLGGWARNLDDGRVELWAEGPQPAVESYLEWAGEGPQGAIVRDIQINRATPEGFEDFSIRP